MTRRFCAGLAALAMLSACTVVPTPRAPQHRPPVHHPVRPEPPRPPVAAPPTAEAKPATAVESGVQPGPAFASFAINADAARAALAAFRLSCPGLQRRTDQSGLTRSGDWSQACMQATGWPDRDAAAFFANQLAVVRIGDGRAYATGYYEPEIAGSRTRAPGYDVPVYKRPPDLVEGDLGDFFPEMKGKKIRGKVQGGKLLPYPDRGQIEDGALSGRALEIGYAADPVEFFFLQVQGSGRLRLPDGSVMRIGYDGQNGREYVGIGKLMRDRGLLGPGQLSMQGVMAWLRANPAEGDAIMRENKSWIFFRELTGAGPLGAMNVAVTGRVTVAADPAFVPLGAPVVLQLDRPEANGLWVAQDTGGAIKGANRFDTFWGAGEQARTIAGGMSGRGQAWLLIPRAAAARLAEQRDSAARS
ncbi:MULTISPECIES: murein transglycosylase A [unclassified Sphingomonas]|uniref:murein transglycosylase A n=1 Tax=unclassified Sphingomonas TaxID=196159 RepID=UPI0006F78B8E|nr:MULTISPECIES: murein transglycosylase A [unclassified Sphingomonas]KQX17729.1 MltA [Sphingomonas sp. Root1294]KQY70655.1 MltA [Sphingomonas sp. Root50]KRB91853.1 MltA [Sphingomonas sp. Root720]